MALKKPANIESDKFMSAKWDEVACGREFKEADVSVLALLCWWYKIVDQAQDELENFGSTAYTNDMGDLKTFPQIGTLKTASAEIRQINKQLGIVDCVAEEPKKKVNPTLIMVQNNRRKREKCNVAKAVGE